MANNVFGINSNEIESAQTSFSSSAGQTMDALQAAVSGLQSALGCGIATNSVGTISRQMSAISNSMNNVGQTLNTQASQMFEYDATMASRAEEIEIPNDFMADNQTKISEYNKSLLEKLDGKTVNAGGTTEPKYKDAGTTVESETVRDIDHASADLTDADKNQNLSSESQTVRDINHASADLVNADKNQNLSSQSQTVRDINHASANLTDAEKNQTTVIGSSILGNIDKAAVDVEHVEDASSVERSMLESINNGQTDMSNLEKNTDTVVGESILGNINGTKAETFSATTDAQNLDTIENVKIEKNDKEKES